MALTSGPEVFLESGCDPSVNYHRLPSERRGHYYYTQVNYENAAVFVRRSRTVRGLPMADMVEVWRPAPGQSFGLELWAPELHYLRGKWYVYVAGSDGNSQNHRMFAIEGTSADPLQPFVLKGKVVSNDDNWAIDGTVLEHEGGLYMLWSGWETGAGMDQHIYIAPMADPWTICGARVCISCPTYDWEMSPPVLRERRSTNRAHQPSDSAAVIGWRRVDR